MFSLRNPGLYLINGTFAVACMFLNIESNGSKFTNSVFNPISNFIMPSSVYGRKSLSDFILRNISTVSYKRMMSGVIFFFVSAMSS